MANTKRNIETCAFLSGPLDPKGDLFTVNTLIIPKQEGTSDTVNALNEGETFDLQLSRSIFPLGWIHTHPSQTCFLSSIDVHTQFGLQVAPLLFSFEMNVSTGGSWPVWMASVLAIVASS